MPIDNRKVLQNILLPETRNSARRTLTSADADEISQMFSQERLDKFVADGVLEGDWKATAENGENEGKEIAAKDLSKMKKAELVAIAEKRGVTTTPDAETKQQIIDKILATVAEK